MTADIRILILGAGDLATGIAHRLYRAGFTVFMTELPEPLAVRRTVAFSECVFRGRWSVEGVEAVPAHSTHEALRVSRGGSIPVLVLPDGGLTAETRSELDPAVLVDARMAKRNLGISITDARVVVGVGPGFTAGLDVHAVVETARGHYLGKVLYSGQAQADTGIPGEVGGVGKERVLRAPADGTLQPLVGIGSHVEAGQEVAHLVPPGTTATGAGSGRASIGGGISSARANITGGVSSVRANITGVLRGLLRPGAPVRQGQKIGDVDPRCDADAVWSISDKSRAVGGGVLEATACLLWGRPPVRADACRNWS